MLISRWLRRALVGIAVLAVTLVLSWPRPLSPGRYGDMTPLHESWVNGTYSAQFRNIDSPLLWPQSVHSSPETQWNINGRGVSMLEFQEAGSSDTEWAMWLLVRPNGELMGAELIPVAGGRRQSPRRVEDWTDRRRSGG